MLRNGPAREDEALLVRSLEGNGADALVLYALSVITIIVRDDDSRASDANGRENSMKAEGKVRLLVVNAMPSVIAITIMRRPH